MVKDARKFVVLVMICLCFLGIFIPVVTARDAFAPSWLKEGAYVKYLDNSGSMSFFNVTDPKFAGTNYTLNQKTDSLDTISSSLMWQCVSVNATMAKLQVTWNYVGVQGPYYDENLEWVDGPFENVTFQRTGEAYVDLYTRGVYNVAGVFLGTTHLWLPANPNDGQEIVIWQEDSKTITVPVTVSDWWVTTVQGSQDIFQISETFSVKNMYQSSLLYDLDTGLCVGNLLLWDPIFTVVGVSGGGGSFSETNINLGPERSATNWYQILEYSVIPVAIILLVVTLIIKRKRKKN